MPSERLSYRQLNVLSLRKVPEVSVYFWIVKILSTALGESTSDYLVSHYNPYLAVTLTFFLFAITIIAQLYVRRYVAWLYWATITMVAIFGTMAADVTHVVLGVPYLVTSISFIIVLAGIFVWWRHSEKTLSIHSVTRGRKELFYWATVLAAFALGTAAGDLLAYTAQLGFFSAGIVFVALFILPIVGYYLFRLNAILTFWIAYVLTRPIGASFADWTGKSKSVGALGWGDGPVAAVLSLSIIALVISMYLKQRRARDTGN